MRDATALAGGRGCNLDERKRGFEMDWDLDCGEVIEDCP
jgi:hypothetical protein